MDHAGLPATPRSQTTWSVYAQVVERSTDAVFCGYVIRIMLYPDDPSHNTSIALYVEQLYIEHSPTLAIASDNTFDRYDGFLTIQAASGER